MKKIILIILSLILSVSVFNGCSIKNGGNEEVSQAELNSIKLDVDSDYQGDLNIDITSEESEVATMTALVNAFNEKYPNITVKVNKSVIDGYYGTITDNASYAYQSKDYSKMSDVFWFAQDKIDYLYDKDMLFPLSAIMAKDSGFDVTKLVDESVGVSKIGNTMYLMPRDYNQVVMYFNQDIFDAANVSYPTSQMSKNQFITMLTELKAGLAASTETNDYGVKYKDAVKYLVDVNSCWDSWCWPLIKQFGGEVVNGDGECVLDSEGTKNALLFWKSMKDNDYINNCQTTNAGVNFRMQQSAIYFHARAVLSNITASSKTIKGVKNLGVCALPQFGTQYAVGGGASGYGMYRNAVNKTEAWLFLKFIVSEAGQEAFSTTGNCVPVLKELLTNENAGWRTYNNEKLGTAFDNDAFVYGLDMDVAPFASTRDFYQYIPQSTQDKVLSCIQSCFAKIDTANSDKDITDAIKNQQQLIEFYLKKSSN